MTDVYVSSCNVRLNDLLSVRKGNIIMGIQEADHPPVDVSQFQGFVVKALAKVK